VVTVLLLVVWVCSAFGALSYDLGPRVISIGPQGIVVIHFESLPRVAPQPQWKWHRYDAATAWWTRGSRVPGIMNWKSIPLWFLVLPSLVLMASAWRFDVIADRSTLIGLCLDCGYNRHGLSAQAVCPECGAAPMAGCAVQGPSPPPVEKDSP
jgi:hypothetical protein